MRTFARTLSHLGLILCAIWITTGAFPAVSQHSRTAIVLDVKGAIGPASAEHVLRGLQQAADRNAALVILRLDTPGGLDNSMREIIRGILASPVPVASYVAPSGARAASAGTYITLASHIAAMAPGTNLGAATPVAIGVGEKPKKDEPQEEKKDGGDTGDKKQAARPHPTMDDKMANDAVAYIRSLAELRGRNAEWAEKAVREAASLPATDAKNLNVVDIIAANLDELLQMADGRTVSAAGRAVTLHTRGLALVFVEADWRTKILEVITDPNIALILLMIGFYGLFFEFMNPGSFVPGVAGAICLIVGIYSLALLPVTFAGIALILLGAALMVGEVLIISHGVLAIGGTIAFVLGAVLLMEPGSLGFEISWSVIAAIATLSLAFSFVVLRLAVASHGRKVATGAEEMIGMKGTVQDWAGPSGHILVHGEIWGAVSAQNPAVGQAVRVTGLNGLTLTVVPENLEIR